jgi:hypothetical protein
LTDFAESPRISVEALRALVIWLGSRDARIENSSSEPLGNVAAGTASQSDTDAGENGFAQRDARADHRGELG